MQHKKLTMPSGIKTIDESLPLLAEIEANYAHVRLWEGNEAETRRKVIDQMLTPAKPTSVILPPDHNQPEKHGFKVSYPG